MLELTSDECRVLGTMIEKAHTVPAQYPITLNALTTACNQKNNRDPVSNYTEEQVYEAMDSLRGKGVVREALLSGSRVPKFRHIAREIFAVTTEELVLLAELWLRGPQSLAELKANAGRMAPLQSLDSVTAILNGMAARKDATTGEPTPYVKELGRQPGERVTRFVQLICPGLHPLHPIHGMAGAGHGMPAAGFDMAASGGAGRGGQGMMDRQPPKGAPSAGTVAGAGEAALQPALTLRVSQLESQIVELKSSVDALAAAIGRLVGDVSGGEREGQP